MKEGGIEKGKGIRKGDKQGDKSGDERGRWV